MLKVEKAAYRQHDLRVMLVGKRYRGVALRGGRKIAEAESDTVEGCLVVLRDLLDRRAEAEAARRVDGVPTAAEFAEALALLAPRMHDGWWAMLRAHRVAPDRALTAGELAEAADYQNYSAANLQYGRLGFELAQILNYKPETRSDGTPVWTSTIAKYTQKFPDDRSGS